MATRKGTKGHPQRTCATMDQHRWLAAASPEYRRRRREIEAETRAFMARYRAEGLRTGVIRIPVVVHVVWNTSAQNISDAQILSQIPVINADFRRTNADAGSVPGPFQGVAADARIEFALAVRGPNCEATNGITRTKTTRTEFVYPADQFLMKSAATGGADPWPWDRYLNIWVVNLIGALGYSTWPADAATMTTLDGLVIDGKAFGTTGTAQAPYNLGRTVTHEIGHWLNLLHIWGDDQNDANQCNQSDEAADTPNQAVMNFGTPAFPHISCRNAPNGDMFMNYMDYVDDVAMFMFTQDQSLRMNATIAVARAGLLSSDGLVPVAGGSPPADLWMQDNADDTGIEPDSSSSPMYISDDIWVRNTPDGRINQDHQNPLGTELNYVYVRVRNRACASGAVQTGTLKLYWAKASVSLGWPAPWDGSVTTPALMGGEIGSQSVTVGGGAVEVVQFSWTPPDPSDYAAFGADQAHFCLLARIELAPTAPFGMTTAETSNLYANVQANNNIVWKNISVVDTDGEGARFAEVVIGPSPTGRHLLFEAPAQGGVTVFDWGYVIVEFRGSDLAGWVKGGIKGKDIQQLADGRIIILKSGALIDRPALPNGRYGTMHVLFSPGGRHRPVGARVFPLDVKDIDRENRPLGGQRFLLKTTDALRGVDWDRKLDTFDGVVWVPRA